MAHNGPGSSGSGKPNPWKYDRRPERAGGFAAGTMLAGPAATNLLAGPAGGARLADLREWHIVEARCARCRHVGRLRPKQLTAFVSRQSSRKPGRQLAGQTRLVEIVQRFACTECGNRADNQVAVVAVERNV